MNSPSALPTTVSFYFSPCCPCYLFCPRSSKRQVHACVGGTAVRDDIRTLQNGVHIVVGTPGRVYDMIGRGALRLDRVGLFVLDEADEMLSRGFKDQIYDVFQYLPEKVQVALFSATMPLEVLEVTNRFMPDPVRILVKKDELTLEGELEQKAHESSNGLLVLYFRLKMFPVCSSLGG